MALKLGPRLIEPDVAMKRTDAFMLTVTAFVLANCISYFVRSGAPYVTGWGTRPDMHGCLEEVGFPFVLYYFSFSGYVPGFRCPWINWIGNLTVAIAAGYLAAVRLADRLPPLWPGQSRTFRCSLRALLCFVTIGGVLLGMATISRSWCLLVRNIVCLAGPICMFAWSWYQRQVSWVQLTVAAVGLTLLIFTVDLRHQDPPIDVHDVLRALRLAADPYWRFAWVGLTVVRAAVPVFGLLSLLAIAPWTYSMIRGYAPSFWALRTAGVSYPNEHSTELADDEEPR